MLLFKVCTVRGESWKFRRNVFSSFRGKQRVGFRRGQLNSNRTTIDLECRHKLFDPLSNLTVIGIYRRTFELPVSLLGVVARPKANSQFRVR